MSTRPATGAPPLRRAGELLVWTTLIAAGARRHGLLGWAAVAYGLEKLSKVAFGTPLSRLLLRALPKRPRERRFGDGTRDIVDEASWESFPASDPPARGIG